MEQKKLLIRSKDDIIQFVNSNPVSKGGWKVILVALGGVFVDAYDVVSLGIGTDQLKEQFHLSPSQLGMLTAIMAVGALLGGVLGGYYTDKFGRNKMFMIDLFFMVFAALGAALAPNLPILILFRFLMGIGIGMDLPVALSFIAEYSNSQKKGQFVALWQALWYIAAVATGLVILPFYLMGAADNIWRWAVGFGAVAALIVLIFRFMFMNESPMWAATHLPLREAAKVLEKTYNISVTVQNNHQEQKISKENKPYSIIFKPRYRARTILVGILTSTQAMQYFAVGFYIPSISAMLFGKGIINSISGTIFFNLFGILGGFCAAFLSNKFGIRKLTSTGYLIAFVSLVIIGVGGNLPGILSALLLAVFIFGHSVGPGAQSKTMGAISYPTELRGLGTGWAEGASRIGNMTGLFLFPVILASSGLAHTLLYLSIVPFIGYIGLKIIKWDPTNVDVENEEAFQESNSVTVSN
ncbi:MFS transporter [Paenibacillus doosanensis]|uniref:MFS transporter n=1 Tax=Paenibacillus doosanensis TaxID=1229154 RepID=UPI00217FB970|nr:MFS transporter [Paenibacillus doosanensis]MCS7461214.1 MFS transporter [Paenibacillus doosanensis]